MFKHYDSKFQLGLEAEDFRKYLGSKIGKDKYNILYKHKLSIKDVNDD